MELIFYLQKAGPLGILKSLFILERKETGKAEGLCSWDQETWLCHQLPGAPQSEPDSTLSHFLSLKCGSPEAIAVIMSYDSSDGLNACIVDFLRFCCPISNL